MQAIPRGHLAKPHIFAGVAQSLRDAGRFARDCTARIAAPIIARTEWRRRRLLILGYHGVSLEDEHLWDGGIYMSAQTFRRRLSILDESKCTVLPLDVALRRLSDGTLPPRAVSLVFDDGFHDFARVAAPILAEFGHSATVFLSSYYAEFNRPIFDIMLCYLLWKGAQQTLVLPGVLEKPIYLDGAGQLAVRDQIRAFTFRDGLTGRAKDHLLASVAAALEIDYSELCSKRLLHMMNAREVRQIHAQGHDVQMHTHRHRVSRKRELFEREIHDNRQWIRQTLGGSTPKHFSFPGGVWQPVEREWLTDLGIQTATTCRPALADFGCDRLLLPRVVDSAHTPERVFRSWAAGSMSFLPKFKDVPTIGQIFEETISESVESIAAFAAGA